MDDRMADSQMMGDIASDAYEAGCKEARSLVIKKVLDIVDSKMRMMNPSADKMLAWREMITEIKALEKV